jgi:MFS family permease
MASGVGAGGLAMAPLVGGWLIPSFGWENSYLALAVITVVLVVPLALLVVKTRPADIGLHHDGLTTAEVKEAEISFPAAKGITLKMALGTAALWLIALSYAVGNFSMNSVLQNQTPYLGDIGFPVAMAAGALGAVGLGSLVGKFIFGWLCDRIRASYAWALGLGLGLAAVVVLMTVGPESPVGLIWLYVIFIGLSAGSWLPTMSMIVSTNFGLTAYGAIYGVVTMAQSAGVAAGPPVAGYLYDMMGDYNVAFIVALGASVVAILAILAVRRPKLPGVHGGKGAG